ncbi:MAG: two-component hybrid sensor and regulator [uncultured bacterium]|nr:MAG: two-component hybrid sensor and regulator [uncultured bacterium]
MLVEDDQMIADIYMKKFQDAGFQMVNAATGKEVLKLASEEKYDLILLDMVLPEMSGLEVLKEIRSNGDLYGKELKVIIFSNLNKADNEKKVLENGADAFIGKTDFSPSNLVDEITRRLYQYEEQKKNKSSFFGNDMKKSDKKRILFIEDEDIFIDMFGKKLEDDGYELEYAQNGVLGNKMASENQYDLIITDIVMPAMPGDEIIRRLKLDDKTKDIPVIVLTASISDEDIQPVRDMGVTDVFLKTHVVPSDLARRVSEILN